jgi:hypothetical protein
MDIFAAKIPENHFVHHKCHMHWHGITASLCVETPETNHISHGMASSGNINAMNFSKSLPCKTQYIFSTDIHNTY